MSCCDFALEIITKDYEMNNKNNDYCLVTSLEWM